ncbi:MAG: hypothetical protein LUC37_05320 [Prevotella sp.]|nr:hypothetical protein [Prevotella sp.]
MKTLTTHKKKASTTEAFGEGRKKVGAMSSAPFAMAKVRKNTHRSRLLDYFFNCTETARSASIELGIPRDEFSSLLPKWVKEGYVVVAFVDKDKRTHRMARHFTANPDKIRKIKKQQYLQLSFLDTLGAEEGGDV